MKKFNYLCDQPAVPSVHREQAESATHKLNTIRGCLEEGLFAVYQCRGGAYGYFLPANDDNLNLHVTAVSRLILLDPLDSEKYETVKAAFEANGWDYVAEKAMFAEEGVNLDEVEVGYISTAELFAEEN